MRIVNILREIFFTNMSDIIAQELFNLFKTRTLCENMSHSLVSLWRKYVFKIYSKFWTIRFRIGKNILMKCFFGTASLVVSLVGSNLHNNVLHIVKSLDIHWKCSLLSINEILSQLHCSCESISLILHCCWRNELATAITVLVHVIHILKCKFRM